MLATLRFIPQSPDRPPFFRSRWLNRRSPQYPDDRGVACRPRSGWMGFGDVPWPCAALPSGAGLRLRECREAKELSQQDLAALLKTSYTVIGKYERDEMKPSIKVAKNIAKHLDTTVGYLLGESEDSDVLKDPAMLKRLNELGSLPQHDRECILYALDGLLRDARARITYAINTKARAIPSFGVFIVFISRP